jgi:hypothetical protein
MDPPVAEAEAEVAVAEVEKAEVAEVAEVEVKLPEKPDREPIDREVPTLDPNFWGSMLQTKREMDKAARSQRYANLIVLK